MTATAPKCPMPSHYGLDCQYTRQVKPREIPLSPADAMDEANHANLMAERVHTSGPQHDRQVALRAYWLAMHSYFVSRWIKTGEVRGGEA